MTHGVEVTLAHENRPVWPDQHRTEGMMAMGGGVAGYTVGFADMGEHLIAGHGKKRPYHADIHPMRAL